MFDVTRNPFVYGEVVPAAAFIDRVEELERLTGDLAAGQKVFLISPRRYGKSSLIRQALAAMGRRTATPSSIRCYGSGSRARRSERLRGFTSEVLPQRCWSQQVRAG